MSKKPETFNEYLEIYNLEILNKYIREGIADIQTQQDIFELFCEKHQLEKENARLKDVIASQLEAPPDTIIALNTIYAITPLGVASLIEDFKDLLAAKQNQIAALQDQLERDQAAITLKNAILSDLLAASDKVNITIEINDKSTAIAFHNGQRVL
jgi:hypothetical protein